MSKRGPQGRRPPSGEYLDWSRSTLERLLQAVEEAYGIGVWTWDLRTDTTRWSPGLFALLGYDPKSIEPSLIRFLDRVHPQDRASLPTSDIPSEQIGLLGAVDCRIIRGDGEERIVVGASKEFYGEDNHERPELIVGALRDVTELRRATRALAQSEETFHELVTHIEKVFWLTTVDKNEMHYISPAYERIWGRSCESLYAAPRSWLDAVHPDDVSRVMESATTRQRWGTYDEQYRILRPDGSVRWVRDRAFPVRSRSGKVYRIAGLAEDITHQRAVEEGAVRSQKLEVIGRLAGGIAHDFNNLLTVILMHASSGEGSIRDPDALTSALAEVRSAAEGAKGLILQLLAFARPLSASARPLDLNQEIRELRGTLIPLIGDHISVHSEFESAIGVIIADPSQIAQVVLNLALNAADAMSTGGVLGLRTRAATVAKGDIRDLTAGRYVVLEVSDTGSGIEAEMQPQIFEPFFTTKEAHGTGLGLSTVTRIIRELGGAVVLHSEVGVGTRFELYFPQAPGGDEVAVPKGRARRRSSWDGIRAVGGGRTILVVDDNRPLRESIGLFLENRGYTIHLAANGRDALTTLGAESVDLVFSDVLMPGMSGLALLDEVHRRHPGLPVVLASGFHAEIDRQACLDAGAIAFLEKPFDREMLGGLVDEIFAGGTPTPGPRPVATEQATETRTRSRALHDLANVIMGVGMELADVLDTMELDDEVRERIDGVSARLGDAQSMLHQARASKN